MDWLGEFDWQIVWFSRTQCLVSIQCDFIQEMQVFDLSGFCNMDVAAELTRKYLRVLINQTPVFQQAKTLDSYNNFYICLRKYIRISLSQKSPWWKFAGSAEPEWARGGEPRFIAVFYRRSRVELRNLLF